MRIKVKVDKQDKQIYNWTELTHGLWSSVGDECGGIIFVTEDGNCFYIEDNVFEIASGWERQCFVPFVGKITLEN